MEKNKNILTNKKMKQKKTRNKSTEKNKYKEPLIYKKVKKQNMNLSFDLEENDKNIGEEKNYNINFNDKLRIIENNENIYLLNDVELFDEPKKFCDKILFKTQSYFFNKDKNYENKYINKIFNHNENVFDNEQYKLIENLDNKIYEQNNPNNVSYIQKGNKIEYNNINQNNSFCVSINNNYNYNFSLNNYEDEEDFKKEQNKKENWKKRLNLIKEQKKRMNQFNINLGNKNIIEYSNINNKNVFNNVNFMIENEESDHIEEEKTKKNRIKRFYSTHFLNNKNNINNNSPSFAGLLNNKLFKKKNDLNENNMFDDCNFDENKIKGRIKEFEDYENNNEDNIIDDKFTFKINKNNIDENNSGVCELDVPDSNMNFYSNSDEKTAQFPDIINKDNYYEYIPKNITSFNDFNNKKNNYINNTISKTNKKQNKIYTKGRYDFLSLEQNNKKDINYNNSIYYTENNIKNNNNNSFNNKNNQNENDLYKNINGKILLTYSGKNKIRDNLMKIKPKNLFIDNDDNLYENNLIINNNIEEIRLNMKQRKQKKNNRERNNSFHYYSSNLRKELYTDFNQSNLNINPNESFLYLKPNKLQKNKNNLLMNQRKYFYQNINNKMLNTDNIFDRDNSNIYNSFYEMENSKIMNNNSFIIYKKKIDTKNNLNNKGFMYKNKKTENKNCIINNKEKSKNKNNDINCTKQNYEKNKIFFKTITSGNILLNNNINIKKYINNNLTYKKKNNKFIDNSSIILNKCKINKKISNIQLYQNKKLNNYYIKLPKINSINCFITKKRFININLNILKIGQISVCYFSKKYLFTHIIKIPKINKCYMKKSLLYQSIKNNNNINEETKNIISLSEDNKRIGENINRKSPSLMYKTNIMPKKLINIFDEKNNNILINKESNVINDIEKNISKKKCKTHRSKNNKLIDYFEFLSDVDINKLNKLKTILKSKINNKKVLNISSETDNKNIEENNIKNIENKKDIDYISSSTKKRRRLGTKIEEEDVDENIENKIFVQIKEDTNNYSILNENNKIDCDMSKIKLLINDIAMNEIIKIFIKVCIEDNDIKEKNSIYKNYFKKIIAFHLNKDIDLEKCQDEIKNIFVEILLNNNLEEEIYEIIGYILFLLIENKLYFIEDLTNINNDDNKIQNKIGNIIKYIILSSGNNMKKYYKDLKLLFKDNDIIQNYISNIYVNL